VCEGEPLALVHARVGRDVLELECTPDEERALLGEGAELRTLRVGPRLFLYGEGPSLAQRLARLPRDRERPFVLRPANLEDLFLAATGVSLEASSE
jgi:hypothetical protein